MTDLQTIQRINRMVDAKKTERDRCNSDLQAHIDNCEHCSESLNGEMCLVGHRIKRDYLAASAAVRGC